MAHTDQHLGNDPVTFYWVNSIPICGINTNCKQQYKLTDWLVHHRLRRDYCGLKSPLAIPSSLSLLLHWRAICALAPPLTGHHQRQWTISLLFSRLARTIHKSIKRSWAESSLAEKFFAHTFLSDNHQFPSNQVKCQLLLLTHPRCRVWTDPCPSTLVQFYCSSSDTAIRVNRSRSTFSPFHSSARDRKDMLVISQPAEIVNYLCRWSVAQSLIR